MSEPAENEQETPETPGDARSDALTYKQRLFVAAYLGPANGNATEAARQAGYAIPGVQGCENLRKPNIRAAIDAKLDGPAMQADEVLARLSDVAAGDLGPFLTFNTFGEPGVDVKAMRDAGLAHLIKSIKRNRWGVTVELHDSQAALDKLGKYHGLWREQEAPDAGDQQLDPAIAAQILKAVGGDLGPVEHSPGPPEHGTA